MPADRKVIVWDDDSAGGPTEATAPWATHGFSSTSSRLYRSEQLGAPRLRDALRNHGAARIQAQNAHRVAGTRRAAAQVPARKAQATPRQTVGQASTRRQGLYRRSGRTAIQRAARSWPMHRRASHLREDNAALVRRAVEAGAEQIQPPTEMFYGANSASVRDPYGHVWVLLSWKEDIGVAEMERRGNALLRSAAPHA